MSLPPDSVLLRIFVGESDRYGHKPLHEVIVEEAREREMAGATVLRGTLGFGAHSRVHTAKLLELSTDLPLVIEIIDTEAAINGFLPRLRTMMSGGLITVQPVRVLSDGWPLRP